METKRPSICVRTCRHVSAPDHPEAERRLLPLARGPVIIQVVRDPIRGPGLPRGSGLHRRSGAPAVWAERPPLLGHAALPGPFPVVRQVRGRCREKQDSGPQGSGCLDVVKDNYKALA